MAPDASASAAAAAAAASALGASSAAAPATAKATTTATGTAAASGGGGGGGRRGVQGLLLVTLRDKRDFGRRVVVACVHLKAKEGAANDAAREAQAREAVAALEEEVGRAEEGLSSSSFSSSSSSSPPATVAILAGDFNAEPGSAPHEAVRRSALPLRCLWQCEREDEEGGGGVAAPAASGWSRDDGTAAAAGPATLRLPPPYTTYKFRSEDSESDASDGSRGGAERSSSCSTINAATATGDQLSRRVSDFIFYSSRSAGAVARWAPLDFEREVRDGLPCERYPSDHAAVLAVLRPK